MIITYNKGRKIITSNVLDVMNQLRDKMRISDLFQESKLYEKMITHKATLVDKEDINKRKEEVNNQQIQKKNLHNIRNLKKN